jgi:LmbE family N-acetylglucosaminyl deacetylase
MLKKNPLDAMKNTWNHSVWLALFAVFCRLSLVHAQSGPHALVVIAHPDDESILSVTLYKLAKEQHGTIDLFVITNGEAGYRYSTLAEQYYGCQLTNAADARKKLPAIRKKELREAGSVLGIAHEYFADQPDSYYSLDEHEPLDTSWNVAAVRKKLHELLVHNHYDYVFCLLPETRTHAGHKAATLLALDEVAALPADRRPVILGAGLRDKNDTVRHFNGLWPYPLTRTLSPLPGPVTDRTISFGYQHRINYKIIANWELAAHKSQGATQMTMNDGDLEEFWYFALNDKNGIYRTDQLFSKLKQSPDNQGGQLYGQVAGRP